MSDDPTATRDREERLRQMANSRKHRGTAAGSDVHVLLAEHARCGAALERVRALADNPSAWAYTDGPSADDVYRALDGATLNADLQVAPELPAERLDLTGRDPATITPIELLAFAFPDVYAVVQERDALRAELGMEAGMRSAAVDELESLRRDLWALLNDSQLSDQETVRELGYQLGLIHHWYSKYEQLRPQNEAALALVDDLLRPWATARPVHPGEACLAAGNQRVADVQAWRTRRDALAAAVPGRR